MKHLVRVCGIAAILLLGALAARAEGAADLPPGYSRPATAGLLAQSSTGAPNPFITMCLKGCDQEFAACHNRNANDASCSTKAQTCKDGCRK